MRARFFRRIGSALLVQGHPLYFLPPKGPAPRGTGGRPGPYSIRPWAKMQIVPEPEASTTSAVAAVNFIPSGKFH